MHNKKVIRKPLNAWKLNRLLDNSEVKEDIKTKIINYLESNEKENTSDYNTYNTHITQISHIIIEHSKFFLL